MIAFSLHSLRTETLLNLGQSHSPSVDRSAEPGRVIPPPADSPQEFPLTPFAEAIQQTRYQNTLLDVVDRAIQDAKFPPKCEAEVEVGFKVVYCGLGLYRDSVSGLLMCPDGHVEPNQ